MKKSILLGTVLLVGAGAFAQNARNQGFNYKAYKFNQTVKGDGPNLMANTNRIPHAGNNNHVNSIPYSIFSSAYNAFGFILTGQNPLSWNQDLNCLALFQRNTEDWPSSDFFPAPAANAFNGYQVVKFTTDASDNDGVTSWDSVNYYQNDLNWGRYPSGVIWNAKPNTTLANGYFVGTGPCTGNAQTWLANWFASAKIPTGADPRVVSTDMQSPTTGSSMTSFNRMTYFSSYSTCLGGPQTNPVVYTGGIKFKQTPVPSTGGVGQYGVAIFKGVYNGTTGFTWTQDSTFINKWTVSGGDTDNGVPKIAFGPDGMTGYIVICGSDATATLPAAQQSYQPMVWKTIDGGITWNRVNADYDWATNNPEIYANLRPTLTQNTTIPAFFDSWGGGITVDVNGKLHYVTAVTPGYSTHPDSLGYGFLYPFAYQQYACDDRPWVFDFMTDGSGSWTTAKVTDLFTRDLGRTTDQDTNASMNHWTQDGGYFDYDNRVRVSRSADGTKIFYSWTDADTNNTLSVYSESQGITYQAYNPNDNPGLFYRGMDVATGLFSPIHWKDGHDADQGGYYFYYSADMAMTLDDGMGMGGHNYRIPITYIQSWDANFDSQTPIDVLYMDDADILGSEFNQPAYYACFTGVKELAGTSVNSVSQNFPNPTNGTSVVKVNLNKPQDITLNVTNSIGQLVSTQTVKGTSGENQLTINAASLNSGMYFYTVVSGDSKVTRKMVVTK